MDIEMAANIGEMFGGLAILITLLFGLRQMKQWNENRKYEIGRDVAAHLSSPMIQRGISVTINRITEDSTVENLQNLSREEKDAINALMVGMNNHGVLTFHGRLSIDIVASFYQAYTLFLSKRLRRIVKIMTDSAQRAGVNNDNKNNIGSFDWLIWLLDRLEDYPLPDGPTYEIHKDWKPPK